MANPNPPNQWKKGQSGNPAGGPPKGYSITAMFREMFKKEPAKKRELMEAIFKKAQGGDPTAQKLIWQYMDGMPPQTIKIKTNRVSKEEQKEIDAQLKQAGLDPSAIARPAKAPATEDPGLPKS